MLVLVLVGSFEKKEVRSGLLGAYVPSSSDMSFFQAANKIQQGKTGVSRWVPSFSLCLFFFFP